MNQWIKFKIFLLSPFRMMRSFFKFFFPQVVVVKCKTCGELKEIDKYLYIAREEAISGKIQLEQYMDIDCDYCHAKKFSLSKRKSYKFKILSIIKKFIIKLIAPIWNLIIFIFGNLLAELWKIISRFWQDDLYLYLKTVISFLGICVGIIVLSQILGFEKIIASALVFVFFVMNTVKNTINRRQ